MGFQNVLLINIVVKFVNGLITFNCSFRWFIKFKGCLPLWQGFPNSFSCGNLQKCVQDNGTHFEKHCSKVHSKELGNVQILVQIKVNSASIKKKLLYTCYECNCTITRCGQQFLRTSRKFQLFVTSPQVEEYFFRLYPSLSHCNLQPVQLSAKLQFMSCNKL